MKKHLNESESKKDNIMYLIHVIISSRCQKSRMRQIGNKNKRVDSIRGVYYAKSYKNIII